MRRLGKLLRKRSLRAVEGVLVVEGAELLAQAFEAGATIEAVYVAPEGGHDAGVGALVDRLVTAGVRTFDLAPGVLGRVAGTASPQPILAVVGFAPVAIDDLLAPGARREAGGTVLVLVDVRDPGNAGTIIRVADASGARAVVWCDGTVDPTNPKAVRASAGSLFHLPVVSGGDAREAVSALGRSGYATVGAVVRGGTDYASFDWVRPVALVVGNEANGLDQEVAAGLDTMVSVPMAGRAESLNVSVAAGVLCFEAARQRRDGGRRTAVGSGGSAPSTISGMEGRDARTAGREPG
ncbi:MAG: TrmH family RNA methyltransferase [Acidimicrobiales bacterium]